MQYWILAFFRFREKAPLERLLVLIRRNLVLAVFFDQLTAKKNFSPIREKWRWESSTTSVRKFRRRFEKSHFWGMAGALRIALSPATRIRSANFCTGGCARPWRTGRAPHIRPASIIRNRHGRLRAKTRFSERSADPPYKSRGCGMPGAGFRATICCECIYSV